MKKIISFFLVTIVGTSSFAESYVTRPAPLVSKMRLLEKKTSFRDLTLDCLERYNSRSCYRAGLRHLKLGDSSKDTILLLNRACELGSGWSCTVLGDIYSYDENLKGKITVKKNDRKAKEYYRKGCLRESESGCRKYSHLHIVNVPVKKSIISFHEEILSQE